MNEWKYEWKKTTIYQFEENIVIIIIIIKGHIPSTTKIYITMSIDLEYVW